MSQKIVLRSVVVLAVLVMASLALAQGPHHKMKMKCGMSCIPELTEEQDSKIEKLHLDLDKAVTPLKADLEVKNAELNKLMVADNPNKKAVHKKIDEIMSLKTQIKKKKVDTKLAVNAILTPDQRVAFNKCHSHCGMKMKGMGGPFLGEDCKKIIKIKKCRGKGGQMEIEEEIEVEEMEVE